MGESGENDIERPRDHRRSAFVGLTLGNLGQQPWSQVVGPYLTLLVASRTASAVAVTFALSAHRIVSSVVLPIVGRFSDRTSTRAGRRVPLIVVGTFGSAGAVALMTFTSGYWQLVGVIVFARVCMQVATIGRVGVTPDVFGRSRWAKAVGSIAAVGFLPGLLTLALIRSTWDQDDPSSWRLTFLVAAVGLALGALAVATLVREAPATEEAAKIAAEGSWRDELQRIRDVPNGPQLLGCVLLLSVAMAGVNRLLPIWARDEMGVGGAEFADLSVVTGIVTMVMFPLGLFLGSRFHPRVLAVTAALVGAVGTGATVPVTEPWMFVVVTAVTVPLTVAAFVSLAPQFVPLFPKGDRVGQTFGLLVGPFGLFTSSTALLVATICDLVGTTDAIWAIASVLLLVLAYTVTRIEVEAGARTDVKGLMLRVRDVGLGPGLFDGSVDLEDVLGTGAELRPDAATKTDIRVCREEDLDLLERVSPSPGRSRFHHARYERQRAGEAVYLIAWLDDAPVGNLCLILGGPDNPRAREGLVVGPEINGLDVVASLRNQGIGSLLIAEAERRMRALGHDATVIGVDVENHDARRLYERLGFRASSAGPMDDSYTWTDDDGVERVVGETVVWMQKRLSQADPSGTPASKRP